MRAALLYAGPDLRSVAGACTGAQARNIALCSQLTEVHRSLAALLARLPPPAAASLTCETGSALRVQGLGIRYQGVVLTKARALAGRAAGAPAAGRRRTCRHLVKWPRTACVRMHICTHSWQRHARFCTEGALAHCKGPLGGSTGHGNGSGCAAGPCSHDVHWPPQLAAACGAGCGVRVRRRAAGARWRNLKILISSSKIKKKQP